MFCGPKSLGSRGFCPALLAVSLPLPLPTLPPGSRATSRKGWAGLVAAHIRSRGSPGPQSPAATGLPASRPQARVIPGREMGRANSAEGCVVTRDGSRIESSGPSCAPEAGEQVLQPQDCRGCHGETAGPGACGSRPRCPQVLQEGLRPG